MTSTLWRVNAINTDGNGITDTATGNTAVGYAAASATAEDTKILVKLDG